MKNENLKNVTWREVLMENGIDEDTSGSLIGFVSWNRDESAPFIGKDITNILEASSGKAIAKDVGSRSYNDRGLLFLRRDIDQESANEIFDIIMKYEQEKVYKF